jgi:signal transduction histidine kinase
MGLGFVMDRTAGPINPKQEEYLEIAQRSVKRLMSLIKDLLDISKIEAGKEDIKLQSVDLVKAAEEMILQLKPQAGEKKIDLSITIKPEGSFPVLADPEKLNEIFINLISNAIKFTRESGKISIEIADKGGFGEVSVIDTGTGISKEDFPKLFKKFEQFNRDPGPGPKGTGLGLAITKGLVELQKGNIRAESEPGKGSKFSFTIPKQR